MPNGTTTQEKAIILSSALLFLLFGCKQTANAQTKQTDDALQVRSHNDTGIRRELDSLFNADGFTRDTLADGTIVIEPTTNTQMPRLPRYSSGQTSSVFGDRYGRKGFFLATAITGILIGLPVLYFKYLISISSYYPVF
ncbi:MAG: hypothetical protein LBH19_14840 [Dysgonamonadaceae bacterium]|jgi:hypothetical protein|nr:hypothetical protein [Dysgonamonadaceae bacterium]